MNSPRTDELQSRARDPRQAADQDVLEALLGADLLTRAELAAQTGLVEGMASGSIRRLTHRGLVEKVAPSSGRARAFRYRANPTAAAALIVAIGPQSVLAETIDLRQRRLAHMVVPIEVPIEGAALEAILSSSIQAALEATDAPVVSAMLSVAAPVDRRSGRLVPLHHTPLLAGPFSPRELLESLAPIHTEIDNDVNWAAFAEHEVGNAVDLSDFVLFFLGPGIGGAVVIDGALVRGAVGLAGEIAEIHTQAGGRSLPLIQCLAKWGLLVEGSGLVDVEAVQHLLQNDSDSRRQADLVAAIGDAVGSVVALLNPEAVLFGGPWGVVPGLLDAVKQHLDLTTDTTVDVRPVSLEKEPHLDGARRRGAQTARHAAVRGQVSPAQP